MKNKFPFALTGIVLLLLGSCNQNKQAETRETTVTKTDTVVVSQGINSKGIGRFSNVQLAHPPDADLAGKGQALYESKCIACHKLTGEKLVGPGWKDVTSRRAPESIMNFITNTQVMLDKDLVAQSEVVTCLVRMPNQDLSDEQARQILEFMRKNDGQN